jgi:hypothetical protein
MIPAISTTVRSEKNILRLREGRGNGTNGKHKEGHNARQAAADSQGTGSEGG